MKIVFKLLRTYFMFLSMFTAFRLLLFVVEIDQLETISEVLGNIFKAFLMGLRFDLVITGYAMALPALVLFVSDLLNFHSRKLNIIILSYCYALFVLTATIAAIDVPYFSQFFERISVTVFEWLAYPVFVLKMVLQEPIFLVFSIPLILMLWLFYKPFKRTLLTDHQSHDSTLKKSAIALVCLLLMFLGIRGRLTIKSPIRIGTAYFCDNPFLNQLGLNPVFTLLKTTLESFEKDNQTLNLMDAEKAETIVRNSLPPNQNFIENSPIARRIVPDTTVSNKPNVVLVIMESMGAKWMERHGGPKNLTPFLDSLSQKSLYFNKVYTAGKHTYNGIFSTLYSFPSLYRRHAMKNMDKFNGMVHTLNKNGYQTAFCIPHDGQFDNTEGFLISNGFKEVISQKNYPSKQVKTTMGVPDDFMFRYVLPSMNEFAQQDRPFFYAFMTASNHGPYYIPDYFSPPTENIKEQGVAYADWALKQFFKAASKQPWFDDTIFVFIADHGMPRNTPYELTLAHHHTPLIVYNSTLFQKPQLIEKIGSQIDVLPTIMGLLKLPYLNNTMGIDLLSENRPYVLLNDDDKMGVLDHEYLYIFKENEYQKLYKYHENNSTSYTDILPEKATEMEQYARAYLQVYQNMLKTKQTFVKE